MTFHSYRVAPNAAGVSYTPRQVATAYGCPLDKFDGTGVTVGIIELGGALNASDVSAYARQLGVKTANVTVVPVDGNTPTSDGPDGADGEVMLDVEVIATVAPGAKQRVYFAPNTDQGFLDAIRQATQECDYVSISWGGPESNWSAPNLDAFEAVLSAARAKGVAVFVASGDSGSRDGTGKDTVDFPASSPSVVGCGGTRLVLSASGTRVSETVWDDNPAQSATGGGVSRHFPGRQVPDVAGNADPQTGYEVLVDGVPFVIGGTSAVAPLYAAMAAILRQAFGKFDFLNAVTANPSVCYDVTVGNNGSFKAGPGRDDTTGLGVVDAGRLLAALGGVNPPPPPQPPVPPVVPPTDADHAFADILRPWAAKHHVGQNHTVAVAAETWLTAKAL